ncbi:MAG: AmmeMemoRadiSam system radical SAM enzyme [Deltaproteobacteria bacterium]|nr:AmmeMemoRadiSam system radical SAM enzyme [Deltaproteobacteria bacterium]MBW2051793.1 AmmeMemoRadiSam system radical SAM enzyme [Deltaproteobacteria bacterium]MBW2139663.1 AmmeMemoRadiSam system radical SAM enzyme [Deltaproteobacteria bacterium]MBW2322160.1 AmmeMemoRadiSam system radical SAM enzyme [Deltaproteobacteria bacterium]
MVFQPPPESTSRREFIQTTLRSGLILCGAGITSTYPFWLGAINKNAQAGSPPGTTLNDLIRNAPLARYWIAANTKGVTCLACHSTDDDLEGDAFDHEENIVKCLLCAQECIVREGERGLCRTRINVDGKLRSLVYGHPISVHVDPIEKKPFYHFRPGSVALSFATAGCPLSCKFCQNWEISQARPEDFPGGFVPPEAVVSATKRQKTPIIAYTYNEPTVFTEYLLDVSRIARRHGISSVLVSCGFMNKEPLDEMCSVLDAIKIDLKGFSQDFYRRVCNANLEPVLRSLKQISRHGVHLEIVNLVVPTLNDSTKMLKELARWIVGELGPDVPVHFTRFHPDYQMLNLPPTPVATLEKAYEIARETGIHYPFVGNVPGHSGNHTYCPNCGKAIILRQGFFVTKKHLKQNRCEYCNTPIYGVWT